MPKVTKNLGYSMGSKKRKSKKPLMSTKKKKRGKK